MALANIEGGDGLPLNCNGVTQQLLNDAKDTNYLCDDNKTIPKYSMRSCRAVINQVNKTEDEHEEQKIRSCTGLVKVSRLSNTQDSQIDTRLAWIMLHIIDAM